MEEVSVIIPVYNAAPYIVRCVESISHYPCVGEIILIDDGSTDGSGEICDRMAGEKNLFVRVLHQPNRGVSAARNLGICVAHKEWIWFVDADDYVLPVAPEKCEIQKDADFVILGFVWEENGTAKRYGASVGEVPYNLWRCWFRRRRINEYGLFFTLGRKYAEDQEFVLRYLLDMGRSHVQAIDEACYYYTLRPGSAMTKAGKKWQLVHDLTAVLLMLMRESAARGMITQGWICKEMKRITKNIIVTLKE